MPKKNSNEKLPVPQSPPDPHTESETFDFDNLPEDIKAVILSAAVSYASKNDITIKKFEIAQQITWQMFVEGWTTLSKKNLKLNQHTTQKAITTGKELRANFLTQSRLILQILRSYSKGAVFPVNTYSDYSDSSSDLVVRRRESFWPTTVAYDLGISLQEVNAALEEMKYTSLQITFPQVKAVVHSFQSRQFLLYNLATKVVDTTVGDITNRRLIDEHMRHLHEQSIVLRGLCKEILLSFVAESPTFNPLIVSDQELQQLISFGRENIRDPQMLGKVEKRITSFIQALGLYSAEEVKVLTELLTSYVTQIMNQIKTWLSIEQLPKYTEEDPDFWVIKRNNFDLLPLDPLVLGAQFVFSGKELRELPHGIPLTDRAHIWTFGKVLTSNNVEWCIPSPRDLVIARTLVQQSKQIDYSEIRNKSLFNGLSAWTSYLNLKSTYQEKRGLLEAKIASLDKTELPPRTPSKNEVYQNRLLARKKLRKTQFQINQLRTAFALNTEMQRILGGDGTGTYHEFLHVALRNRINSVESSLDKERDYLNQSRGEAEHGTDLLDIMSGLFPEYAEYFEFSDYTKDDNSIGMLEEKIKKLESLIRNLFLTPDTPLEFLDGFGHSIPALAKLNSKSKEVLKELTHLQELARTHDRTLPKPKWELDLRSQVELGHILAHYPQDTITKYAIYIRNDLSRRVKILRRFKRSKDTVLNLEQELDELKALQTQDDKTIFSELFSNDVNLLEKEKKIMLMSVLPKDVTTDIELYKRELEEAKELLSIRRVHIGSLGGTQIPDQEHLAEFLEGQKVRRHYPQRKDFFDRLQGTLSFPNIFIPWEYSQGLTVHRFISAIQQRVDVGRALLDLPALIDEEKKSLEALQGLREIDQLLTDRELFNKLTAKRNRLDARYESAEADLLRAMMDANLAIPQAELQSRQPSPNPNA